MTEFAGTRFHAMTGDLAARIENVIAEFGREQGAIFDRAAMAGSHCKIEDLAQEAMMFGLGFYASELDEEEDRPSNVVPFANAFGRLHRAGHSLALSSARLARS